MPRITRNEFVTNLEGITAVLGALTYAGTDLPKWLPNGDDIKTVEQLAAVMNVPESTAYFAALQSKNDHPVKDAEAQVTADADNLYDHTHCHHTSIRRTLGIQPGQFILDTKGDRYVRTWKGVLRFGLPIGALIVPNVVRAPNQHAAQGRDTYVKRHGLPQRSINYSKIGVVHTTGQKIAANYHRLSLRNTKADKAYAQLVKEVNEQYDFLVNDLGIKVEVSKEDPYPSAKEMMDDVKKNKRLKVLSVKSTGGGHATVSDDDINKFRAVHDYFGHAATGRDFSRHGEEAAWVSHSQMFSPLARIAMTSGTRGQNSVLTVEQNGFPQQKSDILDPEWVFLPEQYGGDEQDRRDILEAFASLDERDSHAGTEKLRNATKARGQAAVVTVAEARRGNGWSRSDGSGSRINVGNRTDVVPKTVYAPSDKVYDALIAEGSDPYAVYELDHRDSDSARLFHDAIAKSKENHPEGAAVWVYDESEYKDMRLFVGNDGLTGFALKPDGDIVSVFNTSPARKSISTIMPLAIQEGGVKADCFDTALPIFYGPYGFVEVERFSFDPEQAPEEWREEDFLKYNNGRPDVVMLEFDPKQVGHPWGYIPTRQLESKSLEFKVRHVRDVEYWGMPYGAVIPPGYKPTGRHRRPSKPRSGTNKPDIGKDTDLHTYDPENPQTWWLSHHPWWNELSTLPDGTKVSIHTDKFETETRVRSAMTYTYEKKGDGVETYVRYTDEDDVDIRRGERPLASIGDLVNDALVMSNPNTSARPIVTIEYPDMPPVPIYGSHWGVDPDVLASNRDSFALKDNTMPSDMLNFEAPIDLAVLPKGAAIEIEKHNGNTQYFVKVDDTNIDNPGQWEPFRGTDLNMIVDVPFSDREMLHWIDETVDLGGSYSVADANSIYKESPKHERRRNEIRSVAGLDSLLPGSRIDLDVYDYDNGESFIRENDGTWWSVDNEEKVEPLYIVQKWAEVKERKGAVTHRIGRRNDLPNPLWRDVEIDYEYDEDGFNEDGYNQAGYDREGYDEDGYNEDDRDAEGYDRDGIDENGYDREGYDEDGYNMDGYNRDGESRDGEYDGQTNNGLGAKGKPYVKLATRDMDYNWQDRTPEIELAEQLPTMQEIWDKIVAGDNYGTDIKAVYEMQMESGLRSEVTFSRYDSYDDAVTIEGTIRTPDNQRAGTFTRKIYTHTNGSLTAENYYLKIDTPYQGHGFASEFNRRLENWYIANGFDSVQVHADIDKGGYSWARDGFDWRESSAVQARSILGRIRQKAEDLGDIDTMEQTEDLREQLSRSEYVSESDIPTPFELSNLGWEPGKTTWAGREGMLDSNWYGVKYLNPNSRALNVLQEMVRQGKAESKVKKKKDKGVFIAKEGVRYIPPIPQSDLTIPGIELFERAQVRAPDTTMISAPFGGNHNPYVFRTQDGYSFLLWVDKEGVRTRPIQFREDDPSIPDKRPFVSYDSADDALKAIQDGYDQRRQVAKNKREANRLKRLREQEEIRTGLAHNRTVASVRPISREGLSPDALALVKMVDQYAPDATVVEVDTPNNPSGALYRVSVRMKDGFSYYLDVPNSSALVLPAPAFVPGDPNGTNSIQRFDDTQAALQYIQSEYAKRKKAGQAYLESLSSDIEELLRSINS